MQGESTSFEEISAFTPHPSSFPSSGAYRPVVMGTHGLVAAGHPLAAQAGLAVLRRGGNAFDAAFTTAMVLAVVKPDMNGLGGDAFALLYPARERQVVALNASGPAPRSTSLEYFQVNLPQPRGGATVATVPGAVAAWFAMLDRFGTLPASELLQPAIEYAEEGFPTGYFLSGSITRYRADLEKFPNTARTFLPQGHPPQPFEKFYQPWLAHTLRRLAGQGPASFYNGELAQAIIRHCAQAGGFITEYDLAEYRPEWKTPLQTTYQNYTVYGQPPVSQGHVLLEALNILANDNLRAQGRDHPDTQHLLVEATRLAFADRYGLAGDPAFVDWPLDKILAQKHTMGLRQSIKMEQAGLDPVPFSGSRGGETTYFAVTDRDGNCVSFIQSLFHAFGSGEMLGETGLLLNDRMVGFSLDPASPNCLAPGKRPVHTLNACLIMKDDRPYAALGTPGSDGQVQTNLQLISNLLDHTMPVQAAIEAPRWRRSPEGELSIEDRFNPATLAELKRRGHHLKSVGGWSDKMGGAQAIVIHPASGVFMGGADPRREGYVAGW